LEAGKLLMVFVGQGSVPAAAFHQLLNPKGLPAPPRSLRVKLTSYELTQQTQKTHLLRASSKAGGEILCP
jgi:hypothetical protein